jgi:hypothetical protein
LSSDVSWFSVSFVGSATKNDLSFWRIRLGQRLFSCNNGTVNTPNDTPGDCKLDTKPQPQWVNNWSGTTVEVNLYGLDKDD